MKKTLALVTTSLLALGTLTGCALTGIGGSDSDSSADYAGIWVSEITESGVTLDMEFALNEDGTCQLTLASEDLDYSEDAFEDCTWEVDGTTLLAAEGDTDMQESGTFSDDGETLTVDFSDAGLDEDTLVFTRQ